MKTPLPYGRGSVTSALLMNFLALGRLSGELYEKFISVSPRAPLVHCFVRDQHRKLVGDDAPSSQGQTHHSVE